jgi:hypothetical protein
MNGPSFIKIKGRVEIIVLDKTNRSMQKFCFNSWSHERPESVFSTVRNDHSKTLSGLSGYNNKHPPIFKHVQSPAILLPLEDVELVTLSSTTWTSDCPSCTLDVMTRNISDQLIKRTCSFTGSICLFGNETDTNTTQKTEVELKRSENRVWLFSLALSREPRIIDWINDTVTKKVVFFNSIDNPALYPVHRLYANIRHSLDICKDQDYQFAKEISAHKP